MPIDTVTVLVVFLSIFCVAVVLFWVYLFREGKKRREIEHYGDHAEERVSAYIRRCFPDSTLFDDVYLKTQRGLTQIDHILVCRWGVYVIETKSHNGLILTGNRDWVQKYNGKTVKFYDPVKQNENHCRALKNLLNTQAILKNVKVEPLVVFTSRNVRFSSAVKGVIRLSQLNDTVKSGESGEAKGKRRVRPLTSRAGRKYLDKATVKAISRLISRNCEKSRMKQRMYRERIRENRIYRNRRRK